MQNKAAPGLLKAALTCKCPACGEGAVYKEGLFTLAVRDNCEHCGFPLGNHDSADGPSVVLIFVLGFLLVPLALLVEFTFTPPVWFHMVFWGVIALTMIFGMLRPVKAYIIALQYRHRPDDWDTSHDENTKP